jgi:hypothetical protein
VLPCTDNKVTCAFSAYIVDKSVSIYHLMTRSLVWILVSQLQVGMLYSNWNLLKWFPSFFLVGYYFTPHLGTRNSITTPEPNTMDWPLESKWHLGLDKITRELNLLVSAFGAWAAGHGLYFSSCVLLSLLVLPSLYPVSLAHQAHMSIDGSQRKGLVGLPTLSYWNPLDFEKEKLFIIGLKIWIVASI